jgi:hypothetical protein
MKSKLLKLAFTLTVATSMRAEGLTNLYSFTEETKIKGPFTEIGRELYFACEKGGQSNFGYIGKFNLATKTTSPLYHFLVETKVKGGLSPANSNELMFASERGGSANWGFIGSFSRVSNTVSVLHEFPVETKPKTAPLSLDATNWYVLTERGGAENQGVLGRFAPGAGFSAVASFTTNSGIKFEAAPVVLNGTIYYAAREGGDTTQLAGKGAGAIGKIDLTTGVITKLLNLHAADHGAKIKSLAAFNGHLYFAAEEGGDLSLNSGKGWGTLGWFDPTKNSATRFLVCDDATTGRKPRGLAAVEDLLYFNCGEGGPTTYGTFGLVTNGTNAVILGANTVEIGSKTDVITSAGNLILFTTELGCANYLGGISAYQLPEIVTAIPPTLVARRVGRDLDLSWDDDTYTLERCDNLDVGGWTLVTNPGTTSVTFPATGASGFFRLRK